MTDFNALEADMTLWRRHLHAHPELGFNERQTAQFVAERLRAFGFADVCEGVGGTGVVASLRRGRSPRAIALRADMDALKIAERAPRAYRSGNDGVMHACGHDGHTALLLGAAKILAEEGGFDGVVRFIFQPAEEWGQGALAMLNDGLLERFPFEEIYGLHNMPGYPLGQLHFKTGAAMSAEDNFEITLRGKGGHSSRPQAGRETLVAACSLVLELQTIVARRIDPGETAVVSVTELTTDGVRNVLPGLACVRGDVRTFNSEVSAIIETELRRIANGVALAYDVAADVTYTREFIPLINDETCVKHARAAAAAVVGHDRVALDARPITASEDFARFLTHRPGCFAFLGNGLGSPPLHNDGYDFRDELLLDGARFLAEIARQRLPVETDLTGSH